MLSKLRCLNTISKACMRPQMMSMTVQPRRFIMNDLGLDSKSLIAREAEGNKAGEVDLWKAQVKDQNNALVLSTNDEIDNYVVSLVRDYFLTTKKAEVSLDSSFADHGLDSLDVVELIIKVEDELGYVIDAENLEKFKKPRHFVNFIRHMEAYKEEHSRLPHEGTKAEFNRKEAFPGLPF